jgi:hypothetical protein
MQEDKPNEPPESQFWLESKLGLISQLTSITKIFDNQDSRKTRLCRARGGEWTPYILGERERARMWNQI